MPSRLPNPPYRYAAPNGSLYIGRAQEAVDGEPAVGFTTHGATGTGPTIAVPATDLSDIIDAIHTAADLGPMYPTWIAEYQSATFTSHLIGYCNDPEPAKAAALTWFRANCETDDRIEWENTPELADDQHDTVWVLGRYDAADGMALATDILVRHRRPTPHQQIRNGIEQAKQGRTHDLGDFTQYADGGA